MLAGVGRTEELRPSAPARPWSRSSTHTIYIYIYSSLVPLQVEGEMVGPGEAPITVGAFERFGSGVLPVVAGQLVGARESPLTASPGTAVRLLACK